MCEFTDQAAVSLHMFYTQIIAFKSSHMMISVSFRQNTCIQALQHLCVPSPS